MNKLYDFDYYKNKLFEKYQSYVTDDEMKEKVMKRFNHSLGVCDMAVQLIQIHELPIDINKAKICAILHDYAKYCTMEEYEEAAIENNVNLEDFEGYKKVLHALIGRYIVEKELDIHDEEILKAIETHCTGDSDMSPLQEIIYISDCVEDGRSGEYFAEVRKLAKKNYKKAIAVFLKDTIEYVNSDSEKKLHKNTIKAYEYYKKYLLSGDKKYEQVLSALDHNLIKDVKVYDARTQSPYFDYIIVATTLSNRQMQACLSYLKDDFEIRGSEIGEAWSLIDLNDVIVHIFKEEERERYGIDRLYASLPQIK